MRENLCCIAVNLSSRLNLGYWQYMSDFPNGRLSCTHSVGAGAKHSLNCSIVSIVMRDYMLSYLRDDACEIIISIWISHTAAHQGMDVNDAWRMLSIRTCTYGGGVSGARTWTFILILALFFTRSKITLINYFTHRLQS